jgi:hypothetical protein
VNDTLALGALAVSFALAITAHLAIAVGLTRRAPRWRGPVALVVAPLAPYWAFQSGMRARGAAWLLAIVGYVVMRAVVQR